ncbi:hypothetical protein ACXZ7F_15185 [Vibrio harveyi]
MKSELKFYDSESNALSSCGDVLDIEFSNHGLDWSGVLVEKGTSPYFYPKNVYTPYFYFALALEKDLNWSVEKDGTFADLKTSPATFGLTHLKPRLPMMWQSLVTS